MRLSDLLKYNDIVIQCHDNPDADALASGFALYTFLKSKGKEPEFIYRGVHPISKSNLQIMVEELKIPVVYAPEYDRVPDVLLVCDCQYGQRNVTTTKARYVAIIDHHQVTVELPRFAEIRSSVGSCSTVVWDMLRVEGFDVNSKPPSGPRYDRLTHNQQESYNQDEQFEHLTRGTQDHR